MIITQGRKQFRMINYIKTTSQFHQFQPNWTKSPNRIQNKPRISNFSQNPKLIKLTNKDHVYNSIPTKPNDQFQKNNIKSTKIPRLKRPENFPKIHEIMHENMKIRTKGGVKWSYRPWERKTLQKLGRKRQKNLLCCLAKSEREREKSLKKVLKKFWISQSTVFKKLETRCSINRKTGSIKRTR